MGIAPHRQSADYRSNFEVTDLDGRVLTEDEFPSVRVLRGETLRQFEARVSRLDNNREWIVSYNGAPVRDANGKVIMGVLTLQDVTISKQTQDALIRSEKLAATGRLAASIAHEINNPLESIVNVVYLLERHVEGETAKEYLKVINKQVETLSRIATQTMKFHRENGNPVNYNLADLSNELVEFYRPKAIKHRVNLSARLETEGAVFGFIGEIRQVISNLLINAIQATPREGRVTVHLYEGYEWSTGRPGYRISIADTGHGISRKHRARIFEPFFTTKGESGTGLGLWVSTGIINRAGGSLRVWSTERPGRSGTCFSIFLPADLPPSVQNAHSEQVRARA
jgi:signal transduction histidine kinase